MTLTFKGKTKLASVWAVEVGIPLATITSRKGRGWDDEKTLTEPVFSNATKITKNDLELFINDCCEVGINETNLAGLAPASVKKKGQYIRRFHPKEFDKYFNEVFKPMKQNELKNGNP